MAVMSGNFVQRGQPALTDKFARARMAVIGGADLVVELPLPFQCANARAFASGGVALLHALGCVSLLGFGCEAQETESLSLCARALCDQRVQSYIREHLRSPATYAALRSRAVAEYYGPRVGGVLREPNNILAVEYLRALEDMGSPIRPMGVARLGPGHDSPIPRERFASASYLREKILSGAWEEAAPFVPPQISGELKGQDLFSPGAFSLVSLARLRALSLKEIRLLPEVSEGMEHRIWKGIATAASMDGLYDAVKTKRYTHARIRRILLYGVLGVTREDFHKPLFARVLAVNDKGQEILRACKKTASIPVVSRYAQQEGLPLSELQNFAYSLYNLCRETPRQANENMTSQIYYHKGEYHDEHF